MPTVRADITPEAVFPAPKGKTSVQRLSVFPAEHWEKCGGAPGLYRLMLGERWVARVGERVSLYSAAEVMDYLGRWGARALGEPCAAEPVALEPPHPALRNRSRCRWKPAATDGIANAVQTWAQCDPICADQGWMVFLAGGLGWKPCAEVTPLDHHGKPIPLPLEVR